MSVGAPIPQPLAAQARARPQHLALVGPAGALTYAELRHQAARQAAHYAQGGMGAGDRVALLGPPDVTFVVQLHALGWLGAQVVPLPHRAPPQEVADRATRAAVAHAVVCPGAPTAARAALTAALAASGGTSPCGPAAALPLEPHPERSWPWAARRLRLQTSGTSGAPAQVDLDVAQLVLHAFGSATRLGHHIDDVWLDVLPLHHVGGLMILYRALLTGATVHLPGAFDAAATAVALASGDISLVSLVPAMLAQVLPLWPPGPPPPRLRAVLLGGAPTPQRLQDAALARGLPLAITWGMTEAGSQVCTRWPGSPGPAANVGPPLPFAHVTGGADALWVIGPGSGRARQTGDWGEIAPDGVVTVLGRRDRVLISGGENIAPEEVEAVLLTHPQVADAAVVGRADALWGERPVAHLVAVGALVPNDELVAFCRARLASFKVPVQFHWHPTLPRDGLGKMLRAGLPPVA